MEGTALKMSPEPVTVAVPKLVVADRCDRCTAQALVRLQNEAGILIDFCGHHYGQHEPALLAQGFTVKERVEVA